MPDSITTITQPSEITTVIEQQQSQTVVTQPEQIATTIVTQQAITEISTTSITTTLATGQGPAGAPGKDADNYTVVAADNFSGYRVFCFDASGVVRYASNQDINCINKLVGFSKQAVSQGQLLTLYDNIEVEEPSWNWDTSKSVYLGINGMLTQVEPVASTAVFLAVVAVPLTQTKLLVRRHAPILLN